jgi:heme O synthase-like polyprenyltransferase
MKSALRHVGVEILCLAILTSPMWAALLAVHFTEPIVMAIGSALGAAFIFVTVRRVGRHDDPRQARFPYDAP